MVDDAEAPKHTPGSSLPIEVLRQASKMSVTIDVVNGYRYEGRLESFDAHMNAHLSDVTVTRMSVASSSASSWSQRMTSVFLRGQLIIDVVMPREIVQRYELRQHAFKKYFNAATRAKRLRRRQKDAKKKKKSATGDTTGAAAGGTGGKRQHAKSAEGPSRGKKPLS